MDYDVLYVTLATTRECQLVTADSPLYTELKDTPLQDNILWIEDVPSQD
jgi:predicted nucleic acid-binding protein